MSIICRWLQTLVSLGLWQPDSRIRIRALNPASHICGLDPKSFSCMNGFSVACSWHQLCYVNCPILAGLWSASTEESQITRCLLLLNAERIYSGISNTPVSPSASLTPATRICSCWQCWQWPARRSRPWLEILEGLGPSQAPTVFLCGMRRAGSCSVPQPCSRTGWLLSGALLGRQGANPRCAWEQAKRRGL